MREKHEHKGMVFNIQKYSVHDGPGIRTVVFLKGCPLRCLWCSNPESQGSLPDLAYNAELCLTTTHCRNCLDRCMNGALTHDPETRLVRIDRESCSSCMQCATSCPPGALRTYGREMSVNEALEAVEKDSLFYSRSEGGMTIGGGEPLAQPAFTLALLEAAEKRHIHTALETCGYGGYATLAAFAEHLDFLLYDLKVMDEDAHKNFTGVKNGLILDNFRKLRDDFPQLPVLVRTPVIPGYNDSEEAIGSILDFLEAFPGVSYEMLPYHRFAQSKYKHLGRAYPLPEKLEISGERMRALDDYVRSRRASET